MRPQVPESASLPLSIRPSVLYRMPFASGAGLCCRRIVGLFRSFRPSTSFHQLRQFANQATLLKRSPSPVPRVMDKSFGNFDLVKRIKLDSTDVTVTKWRSRITGLSIVHLEYDSPIVKGYFAVGTEIFNDSGCPHTLEHLVFMGSKKYPYKGIIDHLANRGFSNGTNAWTADDYTCYTVETAGSQGFLQILPIYVDHILFPTLKDSAYITEVHHIDPSGNDSGVVYSEMQGRENTPGDLMNLRMRRLVYPASSAYRSEVGGLMGALRKLDVQQIRDYHAKYYVPHNLALIVAGKLSEGTKSLLSVAQERIEPTLVKHGYNKGAHPPGWDRPFVDTPSAYRDPLKSQTTVVEFPEKDESVGELLFVYQGPATRDHLTRKALDILASYLTSSTFAPLNKEYVELDNPLCTYIYFDEETRPDFVDLPVYVGSVPMEHLDTFHERLTKSLNKIVKEGIDMKRMKMVIDRDRRQLRSKLESSKGDTFSNTVIEDFVLGAEDGSDLRPAMDEMSLFDDLRQWTSSQWSALIRRYYIESPCVIIHGKPSAALADKLEKNEKARTEAQIQRLGPAGLVEAKERLERAKTENDEPIPEHVLTDFPVPDVSSISWIPVQSVQEGSSSSPKPGRTENSKLVDHINADGRNLPFFVQFDHVQSDFVKVHALMSLATLPNRLRPFVTAYLSAFFSLPITTSTGEQLTHEEVVARLDDETVSYENELGMQAYFAETLRVSISVEKDKYEAAVRWMKDLIYGADFDISRLQVTCAKILQSLPELKRDGNTVLSAYSSELLYDESSTPRTNAVLEQMRAVPGLAKMLQENPEDVRKYFEEMRKHLTDPSGMRFSVTGNILDVPNPRSVWSKYFGNLIPNTPLCPIKLANETLSLVGRNPQKKAIVVSLPTIESSFATHTAKGIKGFENPEFPTLRLALEVLNGTESFLWRFIRGSGLAYGASVGCDLEAGLLNFSLYRTSNSLQAFREAAKVVEGLVKKTIPLEDTTVDAAKSTIVYNVANGVSKPGSAAITSFVNQALKNVSQNYNRELLEKYQKVTKGEILSMLEKYVLPLFDPATSVAVVVAAPGKVDNTEEGLRELGFNVEKTALEVSPEEMEDSDSEGSETGSDYKSDGR
ncbi:uncharacterized protein FOMMEDRAFT_19228 [Fomitiporia mediterranea MF3/22]|uniref:uncharacterized protein n=1 Tax=Fomitiporia mediterranea (strain MF3/22) TaxID=694068 RepID=UPI00044078EF|nr:uncharacterized protein FOMMEDRAFT_19228 [Fomitiporia mediterranea MF3/22]EJD03900.1 hypothetical protein FOMMEDRAFT_19228 [Fomitiporia mediterranea MF3/22]